jgi:hypothetical protein
MYTNVGAGADIFDPGKARLDGGPRPAGCAYGHPKHVPLYQLVGAAGTGLTTEVDGTPTRYCVVLRACRAGVEIGLRQLANGGLSEQEAVASAWRRYGRSSDNHRVTESVS